MSSGRKRSMFSTGATDEMAFNLIFDESATCSTENPSEWSMKRQISLGDEDSHTGKRRRGPSDSCENIGIEDFNHMLRESGESNTKNDFLDERDNLLRFLMHHHAPPISPKALCEICGTSGIHLKCIDCFHPGSSILCQACMLESHRRNPTHRLKFFDGYYWRRTSLRNLGQVVQLGHGGDTCPACNAGDAYPLTVLDNTGIHEIMAMSCQCGKFVGEEATELYQFVTNGWYPATKDKPRTVASFTVLDRYDEIACEGKLSGYHFYKSLVRATDITSKNVPARYEEFVRMHREYQLLKAIQRSGRSFDCLFGSVLIEPGGLAVECPACPHPGRNLPSDWDKSIDIWIHTLYVMLDGNYKLRRRSKKSTTDVAMGDGLLYFVPDKEYKEHVQSIAEEKDLKYCDSTLRAADLAAPKGGKGYDVSGIFAIQCRHMLILPNGVGDLQRGERQGNVDYILLTALQRRTMKRLVVSYDVACQYGVNFHQRMSRYPKDMQIDLNEVSVEFVVPQFHVLGHEEKCRTRYSLRYREHMGRTDGENIERGWAAFNALSMATKEMGPYTRRDSLDRQFSDWNFQRILSFPTLFSKRLREAAGESIKHVETLQELKSAFPDGVTQQVDEKIHEWNLDPLHNDNPYEEGQQSTALLSVRQWLTSSERYGSSKINASGISATQWLSVGLELEDTQYRVKKMFNGLKYDKATVLSTRATEKNINVIRQIRSWKSKQIIHMPLLVESDLWDQIPEKQEEGEISDCWEHTLQFPSSLSLRQRNIMCDTDIISKEIRLRVAAATDSLTEIRISIKKLWWLSTKKRQHVLGTGQNRLKQSKGAIDNVMGHQEKHVERYRRNRLALLSLNPDGDWTKSLKQLDRTDLRLLDDNEGEGKGKGRQVSSWIWKGSGNTFGPIKDVYDSLRVDYAKARAQALRWLEEVQLVKEEMARVILFFNWKIAWWMERVQLLQSLQVKESHTKQSVLSCIAYANRQMSTLKHLGMNFTPETRH